ncbi:MAG: glycosyltransferase family 39 protein [Tepidisphaeraceae bacterium]
MPLELFRPASNSPYRLLPRFVHRERHALRWLGIVLALAIAFGYGFALLRYLVTPAYPGSDELMALVAGKQFLKTGSFAVPTQTPYDFVAPGWLYDATRQLNYPKCPPGLPLLVAGVIKWLSEASVWKIAPVASALAVLGLFFLTRRVAGTFAGLLAMLLLAFGQVFFTLAVRPTANAPAVALLVWGMLALVAFMQRGRWWTGMIAGLLIGFAGTFRLTDAIIGASVIVACLSMVRLRRARRIPPSSGTPGEGRGEGFASKLGDGPHPNPLPEYRERGRTITSHLLTQFRLLLPILAWALPVFAMAWTWHCTLGVWIVPDGWNEAIAFDWRYAIDSGDLGGNWDRMAGALNDTALFAIASLSALGIVWMFGHRSTARVALVLLTWFVPGVVLYAAYHYADPTGILYARYLSSLIPALIVAAAWAMAEFIRRASDVSRVAPTSVRLCSGVLVAVACAVSVGRVMGDSPATVAADGAVNLENAALENSNLAALGTASKRLIPAGSLVIACDDDRVVPFLSFAGDWRLLSMDWFERGRVQRMLWPRDNARSNDPSPFDAARLAMLRAQFEKTDDRTMRQMLFDQVRQTIGEGKRIFYVLDNEHAGRLDGQLARNGLAVRRLLINDDLAPQPADEATRKLRENQRLRPMGGQQVPPVRFWIAELTLLPPKPPPPKVTTRPVVQRPTTKPVDPGRSRLSVTTKPATTTKSIATQPTTARATTQPAPTTRPTTTPATQSGGRP